jgi:hypothetical protein
MRVPFAFIKAAAGGGTPPNVTAISPVVGDYSGGTAVTVTGTDFTGATGATIDGVALTSFLVVNSTTITGVTQANTASATAKDVVVQHPSGNDTLAAAYKYWNPSVLAKCMMWLRADLGVSHTGGLVDSWASQVDGGDSNKTVTSSGANRPTQATDAAYNGKHVIKTTGANQRLMPAGVWSASSAIPNEFSIVGHCPAGSIQTIVDGYDTGTTRAFIRSASTGTNTWSCGATANLIGVTVASTSPSIVSGVLNGGTSKLYVNDHDTTNATGTAGSSLVMGSASIFVNAGSGAPTANAASGTFIAEAVWFSDELTNAERLELYTYYGGRYGLAYS